MNLAALILVVMYVSLCAIVVGVWAFKTIDEQEITLDKVNEDDNESGNLLG
jgi:hypothetical protein